MTAVSENDETKRETLPERELARLDMTLDLQFVRPLEGDENATTVGEHMAAEVLLLLHDLLIAGLRRHGLGVRGDGVIGGRTFHLGEKS